MEPPIRRHHRCRPTDYRNIVNGTADYGGVIDVAVPITAESSVQPYHVNRDISLLVQ